jgi:hypothetical protein
VIVQRGRENQLDPSAVGRPQSQIANVDSEAELRRFNGHAGGADDLWHAGCSLDMPTAETETRKLTLNRR